VLVGAGVYLFRGRIFGQKQQKQRRSKRIRDEMESDI
jgi:hypothetical protein